MNGLTSQVHHMRISQGPTRWNQGAGLTMCLFMSVAANPIPALAAAVLANSRVQQMRFQTWRIRWHSQVKAGQHVVLTCICIMSKFCPGSMCSSLSGGLQPAAMGQWLSCSNGSGYQRQSPRIQCQQTRQSSRWTCDQCLNKKMKMIEVCAPSGRWNWIKSKLHFRWRTSVPARQAFVVWNILGRHHSHMTCDRKVHIFTSWRAHMITSYNTHNQNDDIHDGWFQLVSPFYTPFLKGRPAHPPVLAEPQSQHLPQDLLGWAPGHAAAGALQGCAAAPPWPPPAMNKAESQVSGRSGIRTLWYIYI